MESWGKPASARAGFSRAGWQVPPIDARFGFLFQVFFPGLSFIFNDQSSAMNLPLSVLISASLAIRWAVSWGAIISIAGLGACKSGSAVEGASNVNANANDAGADKKLLSAQFRHRCAAPRSGVDPYTQEPYADTLGSLRSEKQWLAQWSREDYLWYRELPSLNLDGDETSPAFFALLKTIATTPSGKAKDSYHYAVPSDEYHRFLQGGTSATPVWVQEVNNGRILLADTHIASDGSQVNRGAELLSLEGISDRQALADTLVNLQGKSAGALEEHWYQVAEPDQLTSRIIYLGTSAANNVRQVKSFTLPDGRLMGYFSFREHSFNSETALVETINSLSGIDELALDLRSNGGGAVYIASVLASMVVDPQLMRGKWFERSIHNDQHGDEIYPFFTRAYGVRYPNGQLVEGALAEGTPLPNLGLRRLFVLTSGDTCSASESIINSLRGVDMEVIQIGATSCGKPYGFLPRDNCGYTYSTINFHSVNAKNEGDYTDGLDPRTRVDGKLAGCVVADTYRYNLGDPQEPLLAAAIYFSQNSICPRAAPTALLPSGSATRPAYSLKPAWQFNKFPGFPG